MAEACTEPSPLTPRSESEKERGPGRILTVHVQDMPPVIQKTSHRPYFLNFPPLSNSAKLDHIFNKQAFVGWSRSEIYQHHNIVITTAKVIAFSINKFETLPLK